MGEQVAAVENKARISVMECAEIFVSVLRKALGQDSPFTNCVFLNKAADDFSANLSWFRMFTSSDGFGAAIIVRDGRAVPELDLNVGAALKSRNLRRRVSFRLSIKQPDEKQIFTFAVAHELGHLIQAIADLQDISDYNLSAQTAEEVQALKLELSEYNRNVLTNRDILHAQAQFVQLFGGDIERNVESAFLDDNYADTEYVAYANTDAEANADFIALWILGQLDDSLAVAPQQLGYALSDWRIWAENNQFSV